MLALALDLFAIPLFCLVLERVAWMILGLSFGLIRRGILFLHRPRAAKFRVCVDVVKDPFCGFNF